MPQGIYLPEGRLLDTPENIEWTSSQEGLRRAWQEGRILEGVATVCDDQRDLHVRIGHGKEEFRERRPVWGAILGN